MTNHIRNFCIIAHIDHGKSTLADRFLELTKTIELRQMKPQYLDRLESERERGITIKMAPVRMRWRDYILNLIDTPGHSDFSYEVSRALAAVEGAILLVDASQGIQAQTLVNLRLAQKAGLKIIGAVNKIDLFSSHEEMIDKAVKELANLLDVQESEIFRISGKTGEGVLELLEAVTEKIPSPACGLTEPGVLRFQRAEPPLTPRSDDSSLRSETELIGTAEHSARPQTGDAQRKSALIFDSLYDEHKGIIAFVRIFSGEFRAGQDTRLVVQNYKFKIKEVGYLSPDLKPTEILATGEIGYIATGIKNPDILKIGDTVGDKLLLGYKEPNPVVFVSLYPDKDDEYDDLKQALQKLKLNDSSLSFEPDMNEVLGRGFKCGFLGQLHFEITAERLEKEFKIKTVSTFPSVAYKVKIEQSDEYRIVKSIEDLPDDVSEILEPFIKIEIIAPIKFLGSVLKLKEIFRMNNIETQNLENKILVFAKMPLNSLIADFDGQLKSVS